MRDWIACVRKGAMAVTTLAIAAALVPGTANADDPAIVPVEVTVAPFAMLEFLDPASLALTIPPPVTTFPGARFRVIGNAQATVAATPSDFVEVPGEGFMGKAVRQLEEIGYRIQLHFPRAPAVGSPVQIAFLPGLSGSGTSPLSVDLRITGGEREGEIRLEAHQDWTPHGGMPALGVYEGEIILTLTAEAL